MPQKYYEDLKETFSLVYGWNSVLELGVIESYYNIFWSIA